MPESVWERMLVTAAEEVLETMFFTGVVGPAADGESEVLSRFAARLRFEGTPSGALTVGLSKPAAQALAGNFLAVEGDGELTDARVGGVICELANMICGALLSRVEGDEHFRLGGPELLPSGAAPAGHYRRSLDVGEGTLELWLALEDHAA